MEEGIPVGILGFIILLVAVLVYCRTEQLPIIKITPKTIGAVLLGIAGTLGFGAGMCLTMVNHTLLPGIYSWKSSVFWYCSV